MRHLFSAKEVNTGRQEEFDYLKGFFMILIFLIHAFQATLSDMSPVISGIYCFGTMTGTGLFIFVMGFGSAYREKSRPRELAVNGIRMVIYQYLDDLLFVAVLVVPYPFVMYSLSGKGTETLQRLIWAYFQYTDVFFVAGIIYFVLALLKRLDCKGYAYPLLGIIVAVIAPFIYGKSLGIPFISYVVTLLIGDAPYISFIPLYFLSYALIGVGAGVMYRHINSKKAFYSAVIPVCAVIVSAWWIRVFLEYGADIGAMTANMEEGYVHPDIWRVIATLAHIMLFAGAVFLITDRKKQPEGRKNPVAAQILKYGKNISKYYALHTAVYFVAMGFHGYLGFKPWQCFLLMLLSMTVTEIMVRIVIYFDDGSEKLTDIKAILILAAPYFIMMYILVLRVYQLNHDRVLLSPQRFEIICLWVSIVMIASTQFLFVRNKKMMEERAKEQTFLDAAREIQDGIVPHEYEYTEGNIEISAFAQPAKAVGGDFYDIIPIKNGCIGIVMGDVSGKGIPAALFMSMVKTMIRDRLMSGMLPDEVLNTVNIEVCAENPKNMFATVFAGVMDTRDGKLVYANAGHTHPVKIGTEAELLDPDSGCVIGLFEDVEIVREEITINPGEGLLLYTDVATETVNLVRDADGAERLLKICSGDHTGDLVKAVAQDVIQYSQGLDQFDDLTLLSLRYKNDKETG